MTPRLFNLNIFWVIDTKIDFSAINSKKFVYYNEELVTNSKFQTQLSRKLQRFRTCHKNKKCFIFHDLFEFIIFSYDCNLLDWSFKLCLRLRFRLMLRHMLRLKLRFRLRLLSSFLYLVSSYLLSILFLGLGLSYD